MSRIYPNSISVKHIVTLHNESSFSSYLKWITFIDILCSKYEEYLKNFLTLERQSIFFN